MQGLIEYAFDRAAGAPLVPGNAVRLLRDAEENYPPWLEAIRAAERYIYFESYIIHEDEVGAQFAYDLICKAQEGVAVRLVYDWLGAVGKTSRRFWRKLQDGGVQVRCYNPPRISSPLGWLNRDHRKMLSVDGQVGFITGLCVGKAWAGEPERGIPPWRDTGIEVRGPAVADIERAFAEIWARTGPALPESEPLRRSAMPLAGDVSMRVVASTPGTAGLLRLDQLVAASAGERLWLADAYFAGIPSFVQGLRAAARDGVDVRLLVPGASDIALIRPISQAGYRPLLEAGVRVFEWKGPMMHSKTAVADGRWARVGSSNLNISSWLGNFELDAVIEDERFAEAMEQSYLADLENSTELILRPDRRSSRTRRRLRSGNRTPVRRARGSASRAAAGALRLSHAVSAAITDRRILVPTEDRLIAAGGVLLILLAIAAILWPRLVAMPLAVLGIWSGIVLIAKAYALRRARNANSRLAGGGLDAGNVSQIATSTDLGPEPRRDG